MSCDIYTTTEFERSLKKLSKRYASMKEDYIRFLSELKVNPLMGTEIKYGLRKVRMAITSKQKGKRGGARVITHTVIYNTTDADVTLLQMYDKSDRANITDNELKALLKNNGL